MSHDERTTQLIQAAVAGQATESDLAELDARLAESAEQFVMRDEIESIARRLKGMAPATRASVKDAVLNEISHEETQKIVPFRARRRLVAVASWAIAASLVVVEHTKNAISTSYLKLAPADSPLAGELSGSRIEPTRDVGPNRLLVPAKAAGRTVGAIERRPFDQDDGEPGARSDRVDHLGVQDLLPVGQPRVLQPGEGAHNPKARRRQMEQMVEGGKIPAQVSNLRRGELRLGQLGQHDGLATAVDPTLKKRLDAVGDLELLRRVAGHRNADGVPARRRL
jgi:hypothetical protein